MQQRTIHLERANKNLEAFTYSAAHDLRTPLRGISGFAEALAEDYGDRLDETGRDYAARIQAGCGRMATLIDDLLHLSQVARAKMDLEDLDLSAEVTAICDEFRARDPGRHVRVTVQDGVRVTADRALIRSALENLLDNAWKFTGRRDGATIEFATTPVGDAPICCYVRDNGVGFDPAYVGKLFQPFQRLHDADEFPGTGVGLASVRRIIDRHGGRTWAEGAVDGGATIYFTLNAKGTPMSNQPILLIEDNADDRDLTIRALKKNHVLNPVAVASNGAEALTMLLGDDHRDRDSPALILLDLKLPKVDGLEVLRRIRADQRTRVIPVVVLTSSKEEADLRSAYDLGANGYVRKPVAFSEFAEAMRAVGMFWLLLNQPPPDPRP